MFDLLSIGGTLKGNVGEVIYTHHNRLAHRGRFDGHEWFDRVPYVIPSYLRDFLLKYWWTIDAFEFVIEKDVAVNIIFYEIKTCIFLNSKKKPLLTYNSLKFYRLCQHNAFKVKTVKVVFHTNWKYEMIISDFCENHFEIRSGNPRFSKK